MATLKHANTIIKSNCVCEEEEEADRGNISPLLPHTESEFVTCRRGVECQSRIFADHRANKILYSQYYISYIRYKVTIFTMYQLFIIVKTAPAVENNNSPTLEDLEVNIL